MLHQMIGRCQDETSTGFPYDGSVHAHNEGNSHRSDGGDILKIDEHANACQPFDVVQFGLHILHLWPSNETSFAAQNAHSIFLFTFNQHGVRHRVPSLTRDSVDQPKSPPKLSSVSRGHAQCTDGL